VVPKKSRKPEKKKREGEKGLAIDAMEDFVYSSRLRFNWEEAAALSLFHGAREKGKTAGEDFVVATSSRKKRGGRKCS